MALIFFRWDSAKQLNLLYLEQERDYTITLRLMTIYGAYITDKAQFYSYRLE